MLTLVNGMERTIKMGGYDVYTAEVYCGSCEKVSYERISDPDEAVSTCACGAYRDVTVVFDEEGDPVD